MSYAIRVSRRADKAFERLDRAIAPRTRIRDRITQLAVNPFDSRLSKELEMLKGQRYTRVGDWRIINEVRENDGIMFIITIQHRSKVYRDLKK
jgi:mRNA interferase RelE/StbE